MEKLNQSFDKLTTNDKVLIPFLVNLPNAILSKVEGHEWNQLVQVYLIKQ